jgi:phosphopantothenoylcysteine decarboxylase/phosphopantothenate--cysteine ligase
MTDPARPRVVLGVGAGIAAYKVCDLLRRLTESGHDVRVVPTRASLQFVGAATWEALSGQRVDDSVFANVPEVPHVRLGQQADLVVVAPATADLLAKAAAGARRRPADQHAAHGALPGRLRAGHAHRDVEHPATAANVATLRSRGSIVLEPAEGRLTGVDTGKGRLPEPAQVFEVLRSILTRGADRTADLLGRRVVVSAGGTREPLDPVRYLGNRSSGRQGLALASVAAARGAQVTLVAANVSLPPPAGVDVVEVHTTAELRERVLAAAVGADVVVMAAAPADFRPAAASGTKIKKADDGSAPTLELVQNPDILAELVAWRADKAPLLVGFAAETGDELHDVEEYGRRSWLARAVSCSSSTT